MRRENAEPGQDSLLLARTHTGRKELLLYLRCLCLTKERRTHQRAPLHPFEVDSPMHTVAVDILGPLPVTPQGNRYVLVAMDYFTKWAEAFPNTPTNSNQALPTKRTPPPPPDRLIDIYTI